MGPLSWQAPTNELVCSGLVSRTLGTIDHREPYVDGVMLGITGYTRMGIHITVEQRARIGLGKVARIVVAEAQYK